MVTYKYGGKNGTANALVESPDRVVVRTRNARPLRDAVVSATGKEVLEKFEVEVEFPDADVSVLKTKETESLTTRDAGRTALKEEAELRFAGRVLEDENSGEPVLYTENIFIKFKEQIEPTRCEELLAAHDLSIKQKLDYAVNTYFVSAPENTGLQVFELAEALLQLPEVELCHPELIRKRNERTIHPKQWHLQDTVINGIAVSASANIGAAHTVTQGEGTIIAVIDDGVDIDHPEFNIPGKVVHARDASLNSNDPRPKAPGDKHGTACAGVATAAGLNASGVAPAAKLMPIRLSSALGSIAEGNAFKWAADHGADVISCSWGPADGAWFDPSDPQHTTTVNLPDSTRLAIDYAVTHGRGGKGCVILFAAGNGNEDVQFDGYASYEKVIAVAACNDTGRRSVYSDFGDAVWCAFPSNDFEFSALNHPRPLTSGIHTTDRVAGAGYVMGNYTSGFGGTSSACPGAAGVAALVLSVHPALSYTEVRNVLKECCLKIDSAGGNYSADGHSVKYGFGRLDAAAAVRIAKKLKGKQTQPVRILSAMVNPAGKDRGNETVSVFNMSNLEDVDLNGWSLKVNKRTVLLEGMLPKGEALPVVLRGNVRLPNRGGSLVLLNPQGAVAHEVSYTPRDVKEGAEVVFN
jgi:hypothetical protein